MKARSVAVRPALGAVMAIEVVGIAAFAALTPGRFGWWPAAVITAVTAALLLLTVHRRNVATWFAARVRWWRTRRHSTPVGASIDVSHGGSVYGVRTAEHEAVTVIRIDGVAYAPTFLRGPTLASTRNVLPLDIFIDPMDQPGGLHLAFDIVSDGQRVRRAIGYPELYSTLLAARGAAGRRTTYLVIRLDLRQSLPGLAYRHSIGTAAAAATERVVKALAQEGYRAIGLNAEDQDALLGQLGMGLATAPERPAVPEDNDETGSSDSAASTTSVGDDLLPAGRHPHRRAEARAHPAPDHTSPQRTALAVDVRCTTINVKPGYVTSYYFSPEDITTDTFNGMWSLRSDHIVHVLALRKEREQVVVSALVRTEDPRQPEQPPTLYLNPLPGEQYAAVLRSAPISQPRLRLPSRPLDRHELDIPIGPTGILVGSAVRDDRSRWPEIRRDDMVMWSLTDSQLPTRITMDTSDFYVRQQLIRAAAAGERIAIYSGQPERWHRVSQPNVAVVQPGRRAEFVPTIVVSDHPRVTPPVGLSSTVITVGRHLSDAPPDMLFKQISSTMVRVTVAKQDPIDLSIVAFRQECVWTGEA